MNMTNLLSRTGKAASMLSTNPAMVRIILEDFGTTSKPLSYAVTITGRHIMALAPIVEERNKMLWYKGDLLQVSPFHLNDLRICATNAPKPLGSSPEQSPTRKQVEKAFFRFVAFFWDYGGSIFVWLRDMFKTHVVNVPTVQFYWKRFHEKMEQSKKNI